MESKKTIIVLVLIAIFGLLPLGCGDDGGGGSDAGTDAGNDGGGGETTELSGIATDSSLVADSPVVGAQVIVDVGDEILTATTDAEGRFSLQVPAGVPITATVAAAGRWACTYAGFVANEEEMPLNFFNPMQNSIDYEIETMTVSGTVAGAPLDSAIIFYGNDQYGGTYFPVESADPVPFDFETQLWGDGPTIDFTAVALDLATAEVLDAVAVSVPRGDETPLAIAMPGAAPTVLAITTDVPVLNGEPLAEIDPAYAYASAISFIGDFYRDTTANMAVTGFAQGAALSADAYTATLPYVSMAEYDNYVRVFLAPSFSDPAANWAMASVAIEPGATELEVDMLDSPTVVAGGTFEPGATIEWEPVAGAAHYQFIVIQGNLIHWWISTKNTSLAFPEFPEGFDTSIIGTGGGWMLRAQYPAPWTFQAGSAVGMQHDWWFSTTMGEGVSF